MIKYRIIVRKSDSYHYRVVRNNGGLFGWLGWKEIDIAETVESAERIIRKDFEEQKNKPKLKIGSIIKEITEHDFMVDKLKGK